MTLFSKRRVLALRLALPAMVVLLLTPLQAGQIAGDGQADRLTLIAGRSTVVTTPFDVRRVAITDPEIANATVVSAREILLDGKKAGSISLFVWGDEDRLQFTIVVEPGMTLLQERLQALFPSEEIRVGVTEGAVILSGSVSSNATMLRVGQIAEASSPGKKVVNMLQVPGGPGSQQVMLQVRFAEVNRRAVTELGVSLFANRPKWQGRSTTQQFAAPAFDDQNAGPDGLNFSDLLNLFFFNTDLGFGAVIKALQQTGDFHSLAEPNLIAYSGQEASFLAGGEFPVPVVQAATGQVSIVFKEFGVRLRFTPTIAGDVIRLHVRPEVSTLDFNNGITLSGFRIPSLTTRYAETVVELRDGQSFAIAGLLDSLDLSDKGAVPFLSKIPIIGYLFRSKSAREERTELMVLITPKLVRPLDPSEVPALPTRIKSGGGGDVGAQLKGGGGLVDAPPPPVAEPPAKKGKGDER
jgi:pilus assembly protein CpaC